MTLMDFAWQDMNHLKYIIVVLSNLNNLKHLALKRAGAQQSLCSQFNWDSKAEAFTAEDELPLRHPHSPTTQGSPQPFG